MEPYSSNVITIDLKANDNNNISDLEEEDLEEEDLEEEDLEEEDLEEEDLEEEDLEEEDLEEEDLEEEDLEEEDLEEEDLDEIDDKLENNIMPSHVQETFPPQEIPIAIAVPVEIVQQWNSDQFIRRSQRSRRNPLRLIGDPIFTGKNRPDYRCPNVQYRAKRHYSAKGLQEDTGKMCTICQQTVKRGNLYETSCRHTYCKECFDIWNRHCFVTNRYKLMSCPACRSVNFTVTHYVPRRKFQAKKSACTCACTTYP